MLESVLILATAAGVGLGRHLHALARVLHAWARHRHGAP